MPQNKPEASFGLEDIQAAATDILKAGPDPIPEYRLLNEVLRLPDSDLELRRARAVMLQSQWVRQLQETQLPDGSWGRFHTQDTKKKTIFRTTEEAIDRAFGLGLAPGHPMLSRVAKFIENVLTGRADISDRVEKSEAWPVLIKLILAGRLAALQGRWPQTNPENPILDQAWEALAEVAKQAFQSSSYRLEDEARAFLNVYGTPVPMGFLESQHALWILSARPLPESLERGLVKWIWNKADGMRYLRVPLSQPQAKLMPYWLRSMNIFTRFRTWREAGTGMLNRIWEQRDGQGWWDFGSRTALCADFPLSEDWRQRLKRKVDYSTCILVLLRRYFD